MVKIKRDRTNRDVLARIFLEGLSGILFMLLDTFEGDADLSPVNL